MLSRYNPVDIQWALQAASAPPPFPPASERTAWTQIGHDLGASALSEIVAQAETAAQTEIPALPATLYLEYARNGQREGYQQPRSDRRVLLWQLVLAECLEMQGRFLDPVLNLAWAICEESSWVLPAHQSVLAEMTYPVIDLGAAATALELAELDLLLGPQLDPALASRIRYEVNRRILTPYLTRHDHWWLYNTHRRTVNNWTAVCNAGVAGAALYLEPDPARLAEILSRALRSMDDYLVTFDPDGGSTEGPGYWNYGFGNYALFAHLVEHFTSGAVEMWGEPLSPKAARFPLRTLLTPGLYVNFSDCDQHVTLNASLLTYLARRLDIPDLERLAIDQPTHRYHQTLSWGLRSLFWQPKTQEHFIPAAHDWFSGQMWMVARVDPAAPNTLVLAAKGGHNGEMHNQNDVGNIIIHLNGESVIPDIGRGRYTKFYFGPQRYEHLANSSLGHSVPVPNGQAQLPGKEYAATLLDHQATAEIDLMVIELKDVYPGEADLASLKRTIALHRATAGSWVELVDEVRFATRPGTMESVLTTFAQVEIDDTSVLLRGEKAGLRVAFDPAGVTPSLNTVENVDLAEGPRDVYRVLFTLKQPVHTANIRLCITPA
ncbi:MAG: heparinase II/III family protein [Anaerolineae bacterium]|nr:heparinase II/III family protein [Anaerolineae bacterium]